MKKMFFIIISLLIATNSSASHCQAIHHEIDGGLYYQEETSLSATVQKYISSLVPGFLVGANAGMFCAILDHLVPPLCPLFWLGSYGIRTKMVNSISNNYQNQHIRHDEMLMELMALISSWTSYYKIYETIHGNPPF